MKRTVTIVKVPQYQQGGFNQIGEKYTPLSMPVPLDGNFSPELMSFLKKKNTVVIPLSSDNKRSYTATNDPMMQAPTMMEEPTMVKPTMMATDANIKSKVVKDLPSVEVVSTKLHNPLEMYQSMLQLDSLTKGSKRDKAIEGIFTALSKIGKKNTLNKIKVGALGGEPDVVPQSELSPLQTEKGEFVIHPNYSVTKSAARLPHAQMNNEVTDTLMPQQTDENGQVVAPGAYVVSKDPLMAIPKKVAEQISLGIAPAYYSEDMHLPEAKELNFADKFFGKSKRMTPAEMTQSVLKKYPKAVRNESEDIFAANSNVSNKKARVMPLEIIKGLNDFMRDSQSTSAALNNPQEMPTDDIPMAQLGTEVKSGLSTTIEEEIARLKAAREEGIPAGVGVYPQALNAMAGITGAAFVGAQNPISKIYQPSASALQDKYQGLSTDVVRGVFDNAQATKNQAWNKAIASGQVRAQDATSMFSEDSMLNAKNQAVLGNMQRNQQLDNAYAGDVINWQNKAVEGQNQNTLFQNKHLSNMGTVLTDTLTNAGNIVKGVEEYKQAKEAGINSSLFDMAKSQEMLKMYEEMMKAKSVAGDTNPVTPASPATPTEIAPFKDKRGISNPMGISGQTDIMNSSLYNSNVFEIDPETGLPRLKGKRYGGKIK